MSAALTRPGSSASSFGTFLELTRDARLTNYDTICNQAQLHTYLLGEMLIANRGNKRKVVRGGTYISERIKLEDQGNAREYTPGEKRTPSRKQTVRTINFPWRFIENEMPYTEAEIDLNDGDEYSHYQMLQESIDQDLETEHYRFLESRLTGQPDAATMEPLDVKPGRFASIFHYVWEHSDGHPPGYTVVSGLNPDDFANWDNQRTTYNAADVGSPTDGIFAGFGQLRRLCYFKTPNGSSQYWENDDLRALKIITNGDGRDIYEQQLRDGQDNYRAGKQDPAYNNPVFVGVPVLWIENLDTAQLTIDSTNAYTNAAWPAGSPRYVFLNCKYIYPVFHPRHFMKTIPPINGGVDQRDTNTLFIESWTNLVCKARRYQGILSPSL